ncbi:MAG: class I SAM-dependent methyltransferase, partial [Afipia sp.]|nr:class I SAM-dependent methyltransferase [Afipia sp.]
MQFLANFEGRRGKIVLIQDRQTGALSYYEEGVFQSHATPDGMSLFSYVHLMAQLLQKATDVLVLGCAAGSLATMLHRQGKRVTLVDDNPVSFEIARQFFKLPQDVTCIIQDFEEFLAEQKTCFDGIAIDVGGPAFRFDETFDHFTCRAIRSRLLKGGRIVMNVFAAHDVDPLPDRILAMLAADDLQGWVHDQPGKPDRNVVLSAAPEKSRPRVPYHPGTNAVEAVVWTTRHQRIFLNALP